MKFGVKVWCCLLLTVGLAWADRQELLLQPQQLACIARTYLQGMLPRGGKIRELHAEGPLRVQRDSSCQATLYGRMVGPVRVLLTFTSPDGRVRRTWVRSYVEVMTEAVVAARPIPQGRLIAAGDLRVEQRDLYRLPKDAVLDLQEAVGKRARCDLRPGQVVRHSQLRIPPLIRRGDRVRLVLRSGPITVIALGEALERGGRGERIRVRNRSSRRTVVGEVVDGHTVEVSF